jgi:hypothetical protein
VSGPRRELREKRTFIVIFVDTYLIEMSETVTRLCKNTARMDLGHIDAENVCRPIQRCGRRATRHRKFNAVVSILYVPYEVESSIRLVRGEPFDDG